MRYILLIMAALGLGLSAQAQETVVSGTVTSTEDVGGLPGVNVLVKNSTQGTVTDIDGNYNISVPGAEAVLVFSSVGYESQEVTVGNRSVIDLQLDPDLQSLDEVVVVGYGSINKRDVTGAISSVSGEEIAEVPVASFDQALQGRAAGVQVNQASGRPGAGTRILIRGTSSISAGSDPLYVIDGFPISTEVVGAGINPFNNINPNDIESVEILKDAAATAIYGSRGANGVVLITTKSGKQGSGEISLDYQRGVTTPVNMVDLANGTEWLNVTDQAWANDGFTQPWDPIVSNSNLLSEDAFAEPDNPFHLNRDAIDSYLARNPAGTNWLDPFWQNGSIEQYSLSASRGFEMGNLYVSGQYRSEEGLVQGIQLDRYVVRSKLDLNPADKITTGINLNLSYQDQSEMPTGERGGQLFGGRNDRGRVPNLGAAILGTPPIIPMRLEDGRLFDPQGRRNTLLATQDLYEDVSRDYRVIGNVYFQYEILPSLSVRTEASMDYNSFRQKEWASNVVRPSFYSRESNFTTWNRNINAYATYDNTFSDDHYLNAVVGVERQQRGIPYRNALGAENLISADRNIGEVNNFGEDVFLFSSGQFDEFRIFSYFGRANYRFRDRYLLGASFRRDGASVFGENNRYGFFPAVSAGWILTEEDFAQGWSDVNLVKLRASYGQTGNPNLPGNVIQDGFTGWPAYGSGGGIVISRLGNPNITWENIATLDASVDFGLWEDRVSGSVGVYQQDVKDMLLEVPIPESQGILFGSSSIWQNFGQLRNQGVEISLSTTNVNTGDFRWTSSINFTSLNNEIIRLDEALGLTDNRLGVTNSRTVSRKGGRLAAYFLAEFAGVDPTTGYDMVYEIDQDRFLETGETVKTGRIVTATNQNVNDNRIVQEDKTSLPTFFGGFNNTFTYKGLSLSAQFTFQGGNYLFDQVEQSQTSPGGGTIRESYLGNYWTPENTNAIYPRPSLAGIARDGQALSRDHTRYLYRGDFARLNFVQVSYNLPLSLIESVGLKSARVFVSGSNLLTFTNFDGYDPEIVNVSSNDNTTTNLSQGIVDGVQYPQVRTVMGGINIKF